MKQDRTAVISMAPHPGDNVHQAPAPTANHHYARMRCAEDAARSLSVQHSVRMFTGSSTPDEIADLRARRDSYYLLAAAHRAAARRVECRVRRALAWSDFKKDPVRELWWMAGDKARWIQRKTCRLVRAIRRVVSA